MTPGKPQDIPTALFEQMHESVAVYTRDGRVLYINEATERMFGKPRAHLLGKVLWDVFPEAKSNLFHDAFMRVSTSGTAEHFEHLYPPWNQWFDNHIYLSDDKIWVLSSNVTTRKHLETQTRRLHAVLARLSFALSPHAVARVILEEGLEALGAVTGAIWLLEPAGATLEMLHSQGYPPNSRYVRLPVATSSPIADAARLGEPIWLESWNDYARRYPDSEARARDARPAEEIAVACLPLQVEGKSTGAVAFTFAGARRFYDEERRFIQILIQNAAQALARAALFAQQGATNAQLTAIVSSSPNAVLLLELDGTVRLWNPAAMRIFGWSATEALGTYLPPADGRFRKEFDAQLARVASGEGNSTVEVETQRQTKTRGIIEVAMFAAPIQLANGASQCLLVMADVTERKRAERRNRFLADASELLSSSLDYEQTLAALTRVAVPAIADWCSVHLVEEDQQVRCIAVAHNNPEMVRLAEVYTKKYPVDMTSPAGLGRVLRDGVSELHKHFSEEVIRASVKDPARREEILKLGLRSSLSVPLRRRGRVIAALSLIYSESDRRFDESDLALAEELAHRAATSLDNAILYRDAQGAIRARDRFLSVASHELNTPLTSLKLNVQSLERALMEGPVKSGTVETKFQNLHRQLARLANLVKDLLDVSRLTDGPLRLAPEPLELVALAEEIIARTGDDAARAGSEVVLEAGGPMTGQWDRLRLDQILQNLISNAVKYGHGRPIRVVLRERKETIELVVRDEGLGIAPEDQKRIFNRFERVASEKNYSGFGLGLWIVKQALEAMGGSIHVESTLGHGATFTVELPREPPAVAAPQ